MRYMELEYSALDGERWKKLLQKTKVKQWVVAPSDDDYISV